MTSRSWSSPGFVRVGLAALLAASGLSVVALADLGPGDGAQAPRAGSVSENLQGAAGHDHANHDHGETCPGEMVLEGTLPGQPDSCAHADEAPPGVDVNKPVSTATLEARKGSVAQAVKAAQEEGVPVPATAAAVTDRVECDGDGVSGYRVQAMYVVAADKVNRYAAVSDQIKQWAAGTNTIFNLSAAKTGGVRDVRFVTSNNGDGTCSPTVLNITLPAGANASFSSTITAMQNAGYTSPARKYLMWVDGTGYCGIAQTYMTSSPGQDNPNNGRYPQFARTDTACWGTSASVEAHELSHTLGSVQGDAPHATRAGHCWDESDRMCYADGGGFAMQQVCSPDQEVLFDCNNDDYYSTYPPAGSYLATHWNTANSRFLIGGGDGVGGGSLGVPTRLGGTMSLNNPAIPGLPTQATVNLEVPTGRTTSVAWTSTRKDCVFSDPTAPQTTVACDAKIVTAASVTATVTDSAGDKIVRTSALTFDNTPRAQQPVLKIDNSTNATYTACPTGKAFLSTTVRDSASGHPIKGLPVTWHRKVGTATPVQVATGVTNADGVAATTTATALLAGTYTAKTTTTAAFPTVTSSPITATVAATACTTAITSNLSDGAVQAGDAVQVTGSLTRTIPGGGTAPVAGERVSLYSRPVGTTNWVVAGAATTSADGTYTVVIKPLASASLQARFLAKTGFGGSNGAIHALTVEPWTTAVTANPSATTSMAGNPITVTGALTQSDGTTTKALPATAVSIVYPIAGGKTATLSATTNASGVYSATIKPTGSGTLTVRYAGKVGWGASTATTTLTINNWATALTGAASVSGTMAGDPVTITGILTQSDGSTSTPMAATPVTITYPLAGGRTATASGTTTSTGRYSILIKPTASGTATVRYAGKAGWGASSTTVGLTVHSWSTALTMTATRNATTGDVTVTGTLRGTHANGSTVPKASAVIEVTYQSTATRTVTVKATTGSTGIYKAVVRPGVTGDVVVRYAGGAGWDAASAPAVRITLP